MLYTLYIEPFLSLPDRLANNSLFFPSLLFSSLFCSQNPTQADIKTAYQRLALRYHPDKCTLSSSDKERQNGTEIFMRVQAAWEALGSEEKRREYESSNVAALNSTRVNHAEYVPLAEMERCIARAEDLNQDDEADDEKSGEGDKQRGEAGAMADTEYVYRRQCRCGDSYDLSSEELRQGFNTVQCGGCSLYITVVQ
jgi:curved DNA-binding protein CbpA